RVHDLEHRAIPDAFFSCYIWRREEAIDFLFGEKLRQVTEALRRVQILRWMRLDVTIEHEKLEEPARGADCARDRRGRESFTRKTRDPFAQVGASDFGYVFMVGVGPGLQSIEIAFVTLECLTRESLLDLNVTEEFSDEVAIHKTSLATKRHISHKIKMHSRKNLCDLCAFLWLKIIRSGDTRSDR